MSFLNLVDFDGSIKRNKKQEAVLNTFNDRERFLRELEAQRKARAVDQKQQKAALVVQRSWRAHRARTRIAQQLREEFDEIGRPTTKEALNLQITRMNVFYHHPDDDSRLVTLCSAALGLFRAHKEEGELVTAQGRLVFYKCLLKYLSHAGKETNFVMPIRFLETFIDSRDCVYLAKVNYFNCMLDLVAKLAPDRDKGEALVMETRLSPRLESLCEQLMLPITRTSGKERVWVIRYLIRSICTNKHLPTMVSLVIPYYCRSLEESRVSVRDTLEAFGTNPTADSVPAGLTSTYFLALLLSVCEHCIVFDEEKFLLLSACAGYKQAMHQLESEGKLALPVEPEARSFMISSIEAGFESPAFSGLCKNAVLFPTDENVWSLVAFEKQIRNSDTVMLLATSSACMNRLWQLLMSLQSRCASGRLANHIDLLKMGHPLDDASRDRLTQALSLFCGCLVASITSVDDSDFAAGHPNIVFGSTKLTEVITVIRDVGLGLIDLAFPEDFFVTAKAAEERHRDAAKWSNLYETVVSTLQTLYAKDSRVHFLPHEFWSNHQRQVVVTRRSFLPPRRRGLGMEAQQRMFTPFSFVRFLHGRPRMDGDSSDSDDEAGPSHDLPATSADMRNLSIIRSIPFVVPFMQRVKIFQDLLAHDREANDIVDDFHSFAGIGSRRHGITIAVRRQHLYEDAFEALSLGNAPNLRLPIRVSMTNWVGLNEVGIDGGGIFREFLTELLRTGFDPDRGFFKYTHDRLLYPNPSSAHLYPDSYSQHFFFLGRVVAKLIYEKQMAEIRFAEFFVAQLLGRRQTDVDLHHMKSYDPAIYKHLKNLRSLTADELAALELDFSVIVDDVGDVQTVDLVPGGRNIRVTVDNRLEYIRTYVNLFLYKRIEPMVDAMRAGVSTVIDPGWLAMFSPSELQTLVSGADADLDVDDMMKHTAVHNIRDEADRDYMNLFWSVVSEMSPEDKRGLLKFITGCSRPPIEGFKMLYPAIGIQLVHDSDHLPTSATCMNLFKLPIYSSRAKLEDKLRYAINAGAGFELS
ncbi:hypothetical protein Y032_0583g298 [Ancylostoma ceylanicum]|uniref:HECT-type E3 ubiquitin transferase n=1 Tax=Ancylostoma ceylanicum TaxID=53326 RepID=A0A016WPA2_9BILA|nr:hypothetical protein Y032_0583g298 [Ancylostoma ceylanicum]